MHNIHFALVRDRKVLFNLNMDFGMNNKYDSSFRLFLSLSYIRSQVNFELQIQTQVGLPAAHIASLFASTRGNFDFSMMIMRSVIRISPLLTSATRASGFCNIIASHGVISLRLHYEIKWWIFYVVLMKQVLLANWPCLGPHWSIVLQFQLRGPCEMRSGSRRKSLQWAPVSAHSEKWTNEHINYPLANEESKIIF